MRGNAAVSERTHAAHRDDVYDTTKSELPARLTRLIHQAPGWEATIREAWDAALDIDPDVQVRAAKRDGDRIVLVLVGSTVEQTAELRELVQDGVEPQAAATCPECARHRRADAWVCPDHG
ncbi:hypothetical protein ACFFGH_10820 [Lysobacter korlensis]|uniref:Uncharacterized protein n=1 Tax=Lysobacter korlensis TaxID=553636 RepID=A0ABV6RMX0_9GAMM